jgi:hypothetical protein
VKYLLAFTAGFIVCYTLFALPAKEGEKACEQIKVEDLVRLEDCHADKQVMKEVLDMQWERLAKWRKVGIAAFRDGG